MNMDDEETLNLFNPFFIPTIYNNFKRRRYAYGLVVIKFV